MYFKIISCVFCLFFHLSVVFASCVNEFSEDPFIRFVREQLGNQWERQMPAGWRSRVLKDTDHLKWEDKDAVIGFLTDRIGSENTLAIIRNTSHFKGLRYGDLLDRSGFYDRYTEGREVVNSHIFRSIGGFQLGRLQEIQQVVKFMENRIGKTAVVDLMKKDIHKFSVVDVLYLRYLEKAYFGNKVMKRILEERFMDLPIRELSEVKRNVEFMERYLGTELMSQVTGRDPFWIFKIYIDTQINREIALVESHFGVEEVRKIIKLYISKVSGVFITLDDKIVDKYTLEEFAGLAREYFNDDVHEAYEKISTGRTGTPISSEKHVVDESFYNFFKWKVNDILHIGEYIESFMERNNVVNDDTKRDFKSFMLSLKRLSAADDLNEQ